MLQKSITLILLHPDYKFNSSLSLLVSVGVVAFFSLCISLCQSGCLLLMWWLAVILIFGILHVEWIWGTFNCNTACLLFSISWSFVILVLLSGGGGTNSEVNGYFSFRKRQANLLKGKQLFREGKFSEARDCFARSVNVTHAMAHEVIKVSYQSC